MPKKIPFWKIRRELSRIGAQVLGLPATLAFLPKRLGEPRRRRIYERDFERLTRLTNGRKLETGKIAIFLIYQPKGLAPSVLATCRWLAAEGFAPFVVSNGTLNDDARSQLADASWRLLERPNFGYDFGGYRDAILLLFRWALAPERLIVMNDSVWMTMVPDLMPRLEAATLNADVVGLLQDEKVRHDTKGGRPDDQRRHLESYFYFFTPEALSHPAFHHFWQNYRMTDFKPHTIKYGELGFSSHLREAGLRMDSLTKRSVFLERLAEQEDAFLVRTLRYAAYADPDLAVSARSLANRDPSELGWRAAALDHIRRAVNRKRFNATFPFANEKIFGTLFLKKSREPIFAAMRHYYLRALSDGEMLSPPPEILAEITGRREEVRTDQGSGPPGPSGQVKPGHLSRRPRGPAGC